MPRPKGFLPGNKEGTKAKGIKKFGAKKEAWNELSNFMITEGAVKYMEGLQALHAKGERGIEEYLDRYERLLEWFKPKLARVEQVTTHNFQQLTELENRLKQMAQPVIEGEITKGVQAIEAPITDTNEIQD
jgi:hypothetical protein